MSRSSTSRIARSVQLLLLVLASGTSACLLPDAMPVATYAPPPENQPPPPPPPSADLRLWAGVWMNPDTAGHAQVTVRLRNGEPYVESVIEAVGDRETFTMQQTRWTGTELHWTYYVPSTNYTVRHVCYGATQNRLFCNWENDHNASGTVALERVAYGID